MKQIAIIKNELGQITEIGEIVKVETDSELKRYEVLVANYKATQNKVETYEIDKFFVVYNYYLNMFQFGEKEIKNDNDFIKLGEKVISGKLSVLEALTQFDFMLETYKKLFGGK